MRHRASHFVDILRFFLALCRIALVKSSAMWHSANKLPSAMRHSTSQCSSAMRHSAEQTHIRLVLSEFETEIENILGC
jgi:hypothetical protein